MRLFFVPFVRSLRGPNDSSGDVPSPDMESGQGGLKTTNILEEAFLHKKESHPLASCFSKKNLFEKYFQSVSSPEDCDVIVVCGGDGSLLHAFHGYGHYGKPFYGLHQGSVGFLMNPIARTKTFSCDVFYKTLLEDIQKASPHRFYPLKAFLKTPKGQKILWAFNEICFFRKHYKTIHFQMNLGSVLLTSISTIEAQLKEGGIPFPMESGCSMVAKGDGILIATPLGSTAYNASAKGIVLPWQSSLLAVTPLNFYGENPSSADVVDQNTLFSFQDLSCQNRSINVGADVTEVEDVQAATFFLDFSRGVTVLKSSQPLS